MTTVAAASNAAVVVFVVIAVVVIIGGAVLSYRAREKRRKEFAAWAGARGWSYTEEDDRYNNMPWGDPFGTGSRRRALDVLTGPLGTRAALCFTYRYTTTSSNGKTTQSTDHYFAIFSVRLPKALPELRVGPEGFFSSIARKLGVHDIEFESEDFNRAFKVQSDDRKFAYDIVNPQLMQALLDTDAPGFAIVGPDIVFSKHGKLELGDIDATLAYLNRIVDGIPPFVWDG